MFSRKFRLPARIVLNNSKFFSSVSFSLRIAKNAKAYNRYAFVVSKKVDPKASQRNEVKRKFRNVLEKDNQTLQPGNDLLFIIKNKVKDKSFLDLQKEIESVLVQAGIKSI